MQMISPIKQAQPTKDSDAVRRYPSQRRQSLASVAGESEFICSKQLARQFINHLIRELETSTGDAEPFYLFSAEKRRVRVTILLRPKL